MRNQKQIVKELERILELKEKTIAELERQAKLLREQQTVPLTVPNPFPFVPAQQPWAPNDIPTVQPWSPFINPPMNPIQPLAPWSPYYVIICETAN